MPHNTTPELTLEERDEKSRDEFDYIFAEYTHDEIAQYFRELTELGHELDVIQAEELDRCAVTGEVPFWIQEPLFCDGDPIIKVQTDKRLSGT